MSARFAYLHLRASHKVLSVADAIFEEPRLAEIYDPLDRDRSDLDAYAALADEFSARTVLDIGCGTGTFACLLAGRGVEVIAVDPAAASLNVARRKPGAGCVRWLHGDAESASAKGRSRDHDRERGSGFPDRRRVGGNAGGSP